jgi:hypothetical protein
VKRESRKKKRAIRCGCRSWLEARDDYLMNRFGGSGCRIEEGCVGLWIERLRRMEGTIGEAAFLLARFHNI